MDKNGEIALNELIDEGKSIEKGISYVAPPSNVWRTYNVYKFADYQIFETWKNKCLRFLSREFEGDRCIKDFENVIQDISDRSYPNTSETINRNFRILCLCLKTARERIIDKLKSFGSDVLSNIVANVITNPSIWAQFK